jgi:hypothetical protein
MKPTIYYNSGEHTDIQKQDTNSPSARNPQGGCIYDRSKLSPRVRPYASSVTKPLSLQNCSSRELGFSYNCVTRHPINYCTLPQWRISNEGEIMCCGSYRPPSSLTMYAVGIIADAIRALKVHPIAVGNPFRSPRQFVEMHSLTHPTGRK